MDQEKLTISEILQLLKSTSGMKSKKEILKEYDSDKLRKVCELACSPYITFGVKKYVLTDEPCEYDGDEHNWNLVVKLLHRLATRELTGNAAQDVITKTSEQINSSLNYVLECILDKDLKCGVNVKTLNAVFGKGFITEFNVQLANKDLDKIKFPALVELKSNGRRNIAICDGTEVHHYSRNGKEVDNFHFFDKQLLEFANGQQFVFDGEVRGKTGDHREQYKAVQEQARRKDNVDCKELVFVIWDVMSLHEWKNNRCNLSQAQRSAQLKKMRLDWFSRTEAEDFVISVTKPKTVKTMETLEKHFGKVLSEGHEGLIVKDPDAKYAFKRSDAWVKMKCSNDEDLPIIGVVERIEKKKPTGILGAVIVDRNGVEVHCPTGKGITHEDAKELWNKREELIGMIAEVQYMNETEDGSLYLPKFVTIRDDK